MFRSKKSIVCYIILFALAGFALFALASLAFGHFSVLIPCIGIVAGEIVFLFFFVKHFFFRKGTLSVLEAVNIQTGEITLIKRFDNTVIESPNWQKNGDSIVYNSGGEIYTCEISTGSIRKADIGGLKSCNNDHAISFDGEKLAFSVFEKGFCGSRIYAVDLKGGVPERITANAPSYLHGWSPDGKEIVYCACRKGKYDIYKANVDTKEETKLTARNSFNDGCEFSPDGKHIWFNSTRDGLMQIWRMDADGGNITKAVSHDTLNCWFPHVSPDGNKVAYIAFRKEDILPSEHLPGFNVQIRMMNYDGSDDKVVLELYGGQGSFNTNSWSPDGKRFA